MATSFPRKSPRPLGERVRGKEKEPVVFFSCLRVQHSCMTIQGEQRETRNPGGILSGPCCLFIDTGLHCYERTKIIKISGAD